MSHITSRGVTLYLNGVHSILVAKLSQRLGRRCSPPNTSSVNNNPRIFSIHDTRNLHQYIFDSSTSPNHRPLPIVQHFFFSSTAAVFAFPSSTFAQHLHQRSYTRGSFYGSGGLRATFRRTTWGLFCSRDARYALIALLAAFFVVIFMATGCSSDVGGGVGN